MEERFKDMTPYDRAVRISLYSNRVGKMEEKIKETHGLIDELLELFL